MRVALHSVIKEGHESGYEQAHVAIPDDLVDSFEKVGIHDWTIWRSGRDLFHLVDCDDFAVAMRALATDPADKRWQAIIGPFVDHFTTNGDGPEGLILGQVWDLAAQRDAR